MNCSQNECSQPYYAKGFCNLHYQRNRNGIPLTVPFNYRETYERSKLHSDRRCSVEGCERKHASHDLCTMHRQRQLKGIPLDAPLRTNDHTTPRLCSKEGCERPHSSRGYCSLHARQWREQHPDEIIQRRDMRPAEERFWSFVRKAGENECWEWTGKQAPAGHGVFTYTEENGAAHVTLAHRYSYMLAHDVILPRGHAKQVHHLCHNPPCVNPKHLILESATDHRSRHFQELPIRKTILCSNCSAPNDVPFLVLTIDHLSPKSE